MIRMIGEIGSNHNNDWDRTKELIKQAKLSGFTDVKFQLFDPNRLYKSLDYDTWCLYNNQQLNKDLIPKISDYCKQIDIKFGITPFYNEAIDETKNYVDFYKISSFDIKRRGLIGACLDTKKDFFISCGLANNKDISNLLDMILLNYSEKQKYYFMHCVSKYPCPYNEAALKRISEIFLIVLKQKKQNIYVGYSDHTKDIDVIRESISLLAQCLEFHFDLDDKEGYESNYNHCWTPKDISEFYAKIEKIDKIVNSKFQLKENELLQLADSITGLRG
jgi:N-acetylneuraminate synthase